ncbi:MAG: hypothetical protein J0J10_23325 [Bosea sp.]|uniref:hypothetical protein n=1 Tax=Bosea sp. (in: a-proteobacteria) TaxID=1871050 RepID=UPI001ACC54C2|nr:hypothetical protein [Bosea sp. (in: a-proteobacteria)]MBN9471705.1 hypothetical protein [Bosea sp. (in: a-proteobacteria)]
MSERYYDAMLALHDLFVAAEEVLTCAPKDEHALNLVSFELDRKVCVAKALWIQSGVHYKDQRPDDQRRYSLLHRAREYWTWRASQEDDDDCRLSSVVVDMPEVPLRLVSGDAA